MIRDGQRTDARHSGPGTNDQLGRSRGQQTLGKSHLDAFRHRTIEGEHGQSRITYGAVGPLSNPVPIRSHPRPRQRAAPARVGKQAPYFVAENPGSKDHGSAQCGLVHMARDINQQLSKPEIPEQPGRHGAVDATRARLFNLMHPLALTVELLQPSLNLRICPMQRVREFGVACNVEP